MIKVFKTLIALTFLFSTISFMSCNDNNDTNVNCEQSVCTEEFRTILILVKDQNQNAVALDSFQTINTANGEDVTVSVSNSGLEMARQFGQYPLLNDSSLDTNEEIEVRFKGFIDNQEVINGLYKVSSDCCHINLVSGNVEFILQ
ncbi:hypothetical protein [Tenacibaculum sp. 190524A05c]|uniref:hypothetical protein n=1 Tax=Tenacibaculum platacis TaxID=3137852 RepID=UPI0032B0F9D2